MGWDGEAYKADLGILKIRIFLQEGLDRGAGDLPVGRDGWRRPGDSTLYRSDIHHVMHAGKFTRGIKDHSGASDPSSLSCSNFLISAGSSPNVTIESGNPMSTSGHGLPTPR